MLLGIEIALLAYGILALVRGEFAVPRLTVVRGARARLLGFIALAPLPLSFIVGMAMAAAGRDAMARGPLASLLELCVLGVCATVIYDAARRVQTFAEAPAAHPA